MNVAAPSSKKADTEKPWVKPLAAASRVLKSKPARIARSILTSKPIWAAAILVGIGYLVAPEVAVRRARDRATRCLAQASSARSARLPECSFIVRDFDYPTGFSYTRHDATYRAEELLARVAMNRYMDAAVGSPDRNRLTRGAGHVRSAQEMMENGSRRISLDELGPTIGSPHLGKLASSIGDRAALLETPEYFGLWYLRRDVVEAALLEGDFERVDTVARRYAEWNPGDADLVTTIGATLCLSNPESGWKMLEDMPAARAKKRYENMQRDYGEIFAVLGACAKKAGRPAPELPEEGDAGTADRPHARRISELRLSSPGEEQTRKLGRAIELLGSDAHDTFGREEPYARALLLAGVLTLSPEPLEPEVAARLATVRSTDEGPLAPRAVTLRTTLVRPNGLYPVVPTWWLDNAGNALVELSRKESPASRDLAQAAAAMFNLAAMEHAMDGDVEEAVHAANNASALARSPRRLTAMSAATAAYIAGDAARALQILDEARKAEALPDEGPDADAALAVLETMVAASSGDIERATELASRLPEMADKVSDADVALHAGWLAVALAPNAVVDRGGDAPARVVSVGQSDTLGRYREHGKLAADATLLAWARAMGASPEERRAFRYALMDHRSDMPALGLGYMIAAGRLLDEDTSIEGREIWIDALTALDARRLRLRSYAWLRMEAARIAGDEVAASTWEHRLSEMRWVASREDDLEATRFLRF